MKPYRPLREWAAWRVASVLGLAGRRLGTYQVTWTLPRVAALGDRIPGRFGDWLLRTFSPREPEPWVDAEGRLRG